MATRYPYPEYAGVPDSWYNQYLNESMGVGDYFTPALPNEIGPAAEYGMTSEEIEEDLRRIDRQRLAGVMDSRPDTGPLFTPRPMLERQFARAVEQPTRAATRGVRKAVPPVSLLQDSIVDPTDLLPQQSITLIGSRSVDNSPADIKSIGREVKAKKPKQRATNPADLRMPVSAPQAPAALLDTAEPSAEPGTSFYDDPMRMGLIQAGLGLLSAPQYSTNMNDVAFFPTAARGIGGFLQGYAGTKQRLAEEERQKLEDEYKRSQIEFDKLYKTALTHEAIGRTEQMQRLLEQPAKDQKEWERLVRKVYPGENNETAEILVAAGYKQGPALLDKIGIKKPANETQRTELLNQIKKNDILSDTDKKTLIEMTNERNAKGELRNSYTEVEERIKKKVEAKQPKTPTAPKLSDNERILLQSEGRTPEAEIAFGNEYTVPVKSQTQYNQDGSQTVIPIYKEIPKSIREKYPELTSQADQIRAQAKASTKRPPQAVLQAQGVAEEMAAIEAEIQKYDADVPLDFLDNLKNVAVELLPDSIESQFQSEKYKRNKALQKEWQILVLRDESGAAIGQDEYQNYDKIYFSQPGDSIELIMAKRRARARAQQERVLIAAGNARGVDGPSVRDFAYKHAREFGIPIPEVDQPTVQDPSVEGMNIPEEGKQYLR
jgi:hypothetical protein